MMNGLSSQVVLVALVTTGVGGVMIRLGLEKGLLVRRRVVRRCPSCGRLIRQNVCQVCTRV
jgi:hypothetical protein